MNTVQFKCKGCHVPLVVNDSLLNLSKAQEKLLLSDKQLKRKQEKYTSTQVGPIALDPDNERLKMFNEALQESQDETKAKGSGIHVSIEDSILKDLCRLSVEKSELNDEQVLEILNDISEQEQQLGIFKGEGDDTQDSDFANQRLGFSPSSVAISEFQDDEAMSSRRSYLSKIFHILSFKYDLDYPVCVECANQLSLQFKEEYEDLIKEKNSYLKFLNKLNKQASPNVQTLETSLADLENLNQLYKTSVAEIKKLEQDSQDLSNEIEKLNVDIEEMEEMEKSLIVKKNSKELELSDLNKNNKNVLNTLNSRLDMLNKLKSSNVFNDVFNISYDGPFGTINGLRLGNLKSCHISWSEINSALGQIVLLLYIIIKRLNLEIVNYRLIPMGSYSKIEKIEADDKKVILECYSSGNSSFERFFTHVSMDQAMIALMNIAKQVESELKKKYDKTIELPYAINLNNNKIGGLNIKLHRKVTDDEWTMACKYFMTNVKYILAYSSTELSKL